jgi:hypothetical protein
MILQKIWVKIWWCFIFKNPQKIWNPRKMFLFLKKLPKKDKTKKKKHPIECVLSWIRIKVVKG